MPGDIPADLRLERCCNDTSAADASPKCLQVLAACCSSNTWGRPLPWWSPRLLQPLLVVLPRGEVPARERVSDRKRSGTSALKHARQTAVAGGGNWDTRGQADRRPALQLSWHLGLPSPVVWLPPERSLGALTCFRAMRGAAERAHQESHSVYKEQHHNDTTKEQHL